MEQNDLQQKISQWAKKIRSDLDKMLPNNPNEAKFRQPIDQSLTQFCQEVGLDPQANAEYTLATGRADAVFNRFVIEYKRPGTLKDSLSHRQTNRAVQQVKKYISDLAKGQRQDISRIAGVAFDGHYIIFVRYRNGDFSVESPTPVTQASLERFLYWLASLSSGIALTPENLNRDFSIEQQRTQTILRALTQGLDAELQRNTPMVRNLFEQWKLFFSESIDYSEAFGGRKLELLKEWASKAGLTVTEPERTFFCLHTYFALLVKLIAWLALSRHLAVKLGVPSLGELAVADGDTLRRHLEKMESGGIFRDFGITNLLEGDFFSWYLYAWNNEIENAVREIILRLDEYDPTTLTVVPEETRDLFKLLYHYLLPREIRHNLGEYYTPDWLAQWVLKQVDSDFFASDTHTHEAQLREKLLNLRWLDPACGSGTFLVLILNRMKELGSELKVNEPELLHAILHNVVGFDINPLAVLTARVNYLLTIADLLPHRKGEIIIPVYLADSVRTPARGKELFSADTYEFPTAVGTLRVPACLSTKEHFDRFCNMLEESVEDKINPEAFVHRVEKELAPPNWQQGDAEVVRKLYEQILDLYQKGMNGLWARLLKNNFAPLTVGEFDYIVGNPPWVNWEHLPDGYRNGTKDLWERYRLAGTFKGGRPRLGAVKVDISALMTYTVTDSLLKDGGRLGFVITQSLFKTAAGSGFRRFELPPHNRQRRPIKVVYVDDMVVLQPFEGASNRTAVMVLEKGKPTTYPVPYTVWRKVGRKRFTYDSTLGEVIQATKQLDFVAEPVDPNDPTSPWLTARERALKAIRKVLGRSDYEAHAGCCTWLNAVYWVNIVKNHSLKCPVGLVMVSNITEGAKVKVDKVTKPIEPDLLYPLLRGRDVRRWKAEPSAWIIVPQDPKNPTRAYPEKRLQADYPKTYGYLKRFEKELRNRSGYKQILSKREPEFYGVMDIGTYTFAPWKVVWTRLAQIEAAVVGLHESKPVVPQETVTLVECSNAEEAHYICALVNSLPFQFVAVSYSQEGGKSMGSMHILEHVRIPRYNPKDPVRRRLSELSQEAHEAAKAGDEKRLRKIEAEIDVQAAKLWGLSDEELREIQQSLRELVGEEQAEGAEEAVT
ncbi:DNA methyltransferase [Thermogutta sp.]|uniref:Eco57I restriction-modification methylase domain-containing protein n=1 Tax=Thermogutta sp. TaxID=1962930 RepID=UPI00321F8B69